MKKALLSVIISIFFFAAMASTYPIGRTTITFNDPTRSGGTGSGGGPGRQIQTEIYYPATSAGNNNPVANGQFPVIAFGHGFVMTYDVYQPIFDSLAAEGYIVALPVTEGSLSPSHTDFAKDLALIVDKMLALNNNVSSIFNGKLNERAAIGGHSMGGGCTFLADQYTTKANCYFTFAAANTNPSAIAMANTINKPHLLLAGDHDCVAPPADHQIPLYNALGSSCKTLVNIEDAMHCQFNSNSGTCSFGETSLFCFQLTLDRNEQLTIVRRYLNAYLGYYLKGNCADWQTLQSLVAASTGVAITQSCNNNVPSSATIIGNSSLCATDSIYLYGSPAGFSYQWSNGEVTDSISVSAQGTFTVTVSNDVCALTSPVFSVTQNTPPSSPGTITGNVDICAGSTLNYNVININGLSYQWLLPQGWAVLSGDTTSAISAISDTTSGYVYVAAQNQCGLSTYDSLFVKTITAAPILTGTIAGADTICINDTTSQTYTLPLLGNATYNWGVPLGWEINSNTNANNISVAPNQNPGLLTAYATNACGNSDTIELSVVIADTVVPIITQSGNTLNTTPANAYQWYFNGTSLINETAANLNPAATGNYSVQVTNEAGCVSNSASFYFQFLGAGTLSANNILVYPNPANNLINVTGLTGSNSISLTDISGSLIQQVVSPTGGSKILNMEGLSPGVYLLNISSAGNNITHKIIKQ
jgi:pimeloyl-ACP methyl ester carboxylesterase